MKEGILNICYKGDRNYVHGTDILNQLLQFFKTQHEEVQSFDMSIYHVIYNKLCVVTLENNLTDERFAVGMKYNTDSGIKSIYLRELEEPLECRYDYFEEQVIEGAYLNEDEMFITLKKDNHYSFIENVVALNKKLLQTLFKEQSGKWYFTRIKIGDCTALEQTGNHIFKIQLKRNLNFKLTESVIEHNGKFVGTIYFSLI